MIKKMGIIHQALFVVNCDMSEHESYDELLSIVAKVKEELSFFLSQPEVYTISALFSLFKSIHPNLPAKDILRLDQWEKQEKFVNLSIKETSRFDSDFYHKRIGKRYFLIFNNYAEHQGLILSGISNWITVNQEILARDANDARQLIASIRQQQKRMNQIKAGVKNTVEGAVPKIKQEIKKETNRFFDFSSGIVLGGIIEFIKTYTISSQKYENSLTTEKLSNTLYLVYQDFKQALDNTLAETFQPELTHFVKQIEKKIESYFQSILDPYRAIIENALIESNNTRKELGGQHTRSHKIKNIERTDLDSLKTISGLKLSPLVAYLRYSAKIKTEGAIRSSFYAMAQLIKKIFYKQTTDNKKDKLKAIQLILRRIKRETQKTLLFQCDNYRENLELNYLFRLVDVVSHHLSEALLENFQVYDTDLSLTTGQISKGQINKQKAYKILKDIQLMTDDLIARVTRIKEQIDE
jgi:hypothetical protein